jgi:predicted nucleic acid-binding protein
VDGFLLDTTILSAYLDPNHRNQADTRRAVDALDPAAPRYLSVVSLAELIFGANLAEAFGMGHLTVLHAIVREAQAYDVLDITRHTAAIYAELKTNLAKSYLAKASRRDRPRWLENWVDKSSGQKLQVDENDLWMCAQAKERDVIFVTADARNGSLTRTWMSGCFSSDEAVLGACRALSDIFRLARHILD